MSRDFCTISKPLYVLKAKRMEEGPARPLSHEERLAGWRNGKSWTGEPLIVNEWHEEGRMHSLTAPHLLSWDVRPGEEVVAVLNVEFYQKVKLGDETHTASFRIESAVVEVVVGSHRINSERFLVEIDTVLGRAVMLGEDGAEDAFRSTAVQECLEAAVNEDDWRRSLCSCKLVPEPDEPEAFKAWCERRDAAQVVVKRRQEAE